jgi:hypothetical protein
MLLEVKYSLLRPEGDLMIGRNKGSIDIRNDQTP